MARQDKSSYMSRILDVFTESGRELMRGRVSDGFEIYRDGDAHVFYRLADNRVIHLQGYPGFSNDETMVVIGRLRDYQKMIKIRAEGKANIGNEHDSDIDSLFLVVGPDNRTTYDSATLVTKITKRLARMTEETQPNYLPPHVKMV